jgi:hypothetical protein
MKYFIFSILAISISCSQVCITGDGNLLDSKRELEPFNGIEFDFPADLIIENTGGNHTRSIEILAQAAISDAITTKIKNGILHISLKGCISSYTPVTMKLYLDGPLSQIDLTGVGSVVSEEILVLENASVSLTGSGKIYIKCTSNSRIETNISGSGDIVLAGSAPELDINLTGSGNIEALGLQTSRAHVNQTGSGNINLFVTDELGYSLTGTGDLLYRGNPTITEDKITGTGVVNRLSPN